MRILRSAVAAGIGGIGGIGMGKVRVAGTASTAFVATVTAACGPTVMVMVTGPSTLIAISAASSISNAKFIFGKLHYLLRALDERRVFVLQYPGAHQLDVGAALTADGALVGEHEQAATRERGTGAGAIPAPGAHVDGVGVDAVDAAALGSDLQATSGV